MSARATVLAEIARRGPIPFADFMALALYEPRFGYYATGAERLGTDGDFFTASDVGTAFGECLARQWVEMDAVLGHPGTFDALEIGAGRGLLARDCVDALAAMAPDLRLRLRVVLADESPSMRQACAVAVPEARVCAPDAIEAGRIGCVVAVELFDALPVHRVRRRATGLREVFVDATPAGELFEREQDPLPQVAELALRYGAAPEDGDEAEVCPAALAMIDRIAAALTRGFVVIVDYGHDAAELYGPARRRGTLLAYREHATSEEYLAHVGEQDLTAHVNFSMLQDRARERGLQVVGRTTQDRFLIANGILERFEGSPERWGEPARVRGRLQAMQLLHPLGMGRAFHVLVLAKGLDAMPSLAGLVDPFRRDR